MPRDVRRSSPVDEHLLAVARRARSAGGDGLPDGGVDRRREHVDQRDAELADRAASARDRRPCRRRPRVDEIGLELRRSTVVVPKYVTLRPAPRPAGGRRLGVERGLRNRLLGLARARPQQANRLVGGRVVVLEPDRGSARPPCSGTRRRLLLRRARRRRRQRRRALVPARSTGRHLGDAARVPHRLERVVREVAAVAAVGIASAQMSCDAAVAARVQLVAERAQVVGAAAPARSTAAAAGTGPPTPLMVSVAAPLPTT